MKLIESYASFGGKQEVWSHHSELCECEMRFGIFLPPDVSTKPAPVLYWLSGLTCTEQNFITKAGAQRAAAEHGLIIVAPDTSPRGTLVPDDPEYDLGQGAGFYVDATKEPWSNHYNMYSYITVELPAVIEGTFPTLPLRSICGHSMGGHGALVAALREPQKYTSVSAFAPICAPSSCPWGQKALAAYLGDEREDWHRWDANALVASRLESRTSLLIDQGLEDPFLDEQLGIEVFAATCAEVGHPLELREHERYDHSYYFIASFISDHIAFHADALRAAAD